MAVRSTGAFHIWRIRRRLFFFISGFITYTAARSEAPGDFIYRRIVGIVPLYWIATAAFFLLALASASTEIAGWTTREIAASLAFVRNFSPQHPGMAWPILVPGWTLNFEMFFYALFAIGLATRRIVAVPVVIIVLLVALGLMLHPAQAWAKTYTSILLLEFLCGLLIAIARPAIPVAFWPLLPFEILSLLALSPAGQPSLAVESLRIAAAGAVLAGALACESPRLARWRGATLLGDASYLIYLSHTVALQFVRAFWKRLPLHGWPQFVSFGLVAFVVCVAVGVVIHLYVENPLTGWLLRRRAVVPA